MNRVEEMWHEYDGDEKTLREVGRQHNISGERVRQLLEEAGYTTRSRGRAREVRRAHQRKEAELRREELRAMHLNDCKSIRDIARETGLTAEVVRLVVVGEG